MPMLCLTEKSNMCHHDQPEPEIQDPLELITAILKPSIPHLLTKNPPLDVGNELSTFVLPTHDIYSRGAQLLSPVTCGTSLKLFFNRANLRAL